MLKRIRSALSGRRHDDDVPGHPIAQRVREARLTYLTYRKLNALSHAVGAIELDDVEGSIIECGCALGGSSILLTSLKSDDRELFVHDVFDMIPPPTEEDGEDVIERYETIKAGKSKGLGSDEYYGYVDDLKQKVADNIESFGYDLDDHNVHLVEGLVQDTLAPDGPVALAHIDVDWYEPVMCCLERITPHLSIGGYLVIDDYNDWSGCRKATDEFLAAHGADFERNEDAVSLVLRRR
jgi:asparagine synthase (glutamine-hydrolysing)